MMFDVEAQKALHAQLRAKGYQGNCEELVDELRAQSYGSEIRYFLSSALSVTLGDYPEAQALMVSLCLQAEKRFGRITTGTWDLSSSASIVFSPIKRRTRERGAPLRMDCFALTAEVRAGTAEVRIQTYLENELRRDISRRFEQTKKKGRGK